MKKYMICHTRSGCMSYVNEEEVDDIMKFYNLNYTVWDSYWNKDTNVKMNARQDIFLFEIEKENK